MASSSPRKDKRQPRRRRSRLTLVPLEAPVQFPIRNAAIVFELLPARRVHIVLDHVVAEGLLQHLRLGQRLGGVAQRLGDLRQARGLIGVADEGLVGAKVPAWKRL